MTLFWALEAPEAFIFCSHRSLKVSSKPVLHSTGVTSHNSGRCHFCIFDVNKFDWTWDPPAETFNTTFVNERKGRAVKCFRYSFNCYESLTVIRMALNFLSLSRAKFLTKGDYRVFVEVIIYKVLIRHSAEPLQEWTLVQNSDIHGSKHVLLTETRKMFYTN